MLRNTFRFVFLFMATLLPLIFLGCPSPATYQTTITPVYAATNSGLFVFDGTSWTNYTTANGLASNAVTSVVVSGSGSGATVFAGTAGAGISYSHGSTWTTWTTANGLGNNAISRLFLGSNLFAATSGGLSTYNYGGTWTNAATPASVNDVSFYGTFTYVAANAGLYVFNGTSQVLASPYTPSSIIALSTKVNAVLVDSAQDIIAGTDKGLAILNYGASPPFTSLGLPANTNVHGLFLDSTGTLYAASGSGLFILGTSTYQALPTTPVLCVYVDGAGTIYAGTGTGLKISTDGGTSWTTSLAGQTVNCVVATAPLYSF